MVYNAYYAGDFIEDNAGPAKKEITTISLAGPLAFWIGLIIIAAVLQLVAVPFTASYGRTTLSKELAAVGNYIIYEPGILILPILASLWMGERVSHLDKHMSYVATKGVANATYAIIVYSVAALIVYLAMMYQKMGVLSSFSTVSFIEYIILVPCAIVLIVVTTFAVISAARRYG